MRPRIELRFLFPMLAACTSEPSAPDMPSTVLQATVVRGPIMPVCRLDNEPTCDDLPFAAAFELFRGSTRVAVTRSDSSGVFRVRLAPGSYMVVPGADAPIIEPRRQGKAVTVTSDSVTRVLLTFDTGIRG
jgi:hypothetical protein